MKNVPISELLFNLFKEKYYLDTLGYDNYSPYNIGVDLDRKTEAYKREATIFRNKMNVKAEGDDNKPKQFTVPVNEVTKLYNDLCKPENMFNSQVAQVAKKE
ncbi:hypothetical protein SAMD00019534_080630 [Acytostelium subglobosum LB1]|uniref:hypothetical protein n=1 Tax=Acytostelium subglobosum LB1 TaxID=1410327 RepID=UPI000644B083|nr:hypothetical protein SAMD00019534_080630 [Acytostelium subglobosum LB1]GAM24888.1 hypothetical protein SAMD00019534_080630 [Acytostelium subglobosum LB1]|eukprot:XP_012751977.1 hypothetical protein SAMD00019534_080630 [Acytostelium subglobosum LB1]